MLLRDSGDVVDREVKQPQVAVGAVAHVIDHLGREQNTEALLAVAECGQESFAVAISEPIVGTGIIDFSGVLTLAVQPLRTAFRR